MPDQYSETVEDEIDTYLARVIEDQNQPDIQFRAQKISGDVAGTIIDTASREEADLIVMTTHGYSGITRWMLGSVTERVFRGASCPVLAIRQDKPLKHMLITLDGSRLAEQILSPAFGLAHQLSERVTLLRADFEEKLTDLEIGLLDLADSELCREIAEHPEKRLSYYLDCAAGKFSTQGLKLETVVVKGPPAQTILEFAEAEEVDLIAMASHGYSGMRRWVYGSVTEKVLRNANCAMLIVRPPAQMLVT